MQLTGSTSPCRHGRVLTTRTLASLAGGLVLLATAVPAWGGTLDRVRQSGKLTFGYRADARPLSYRDESGAPDGYSVALCRKIAEDLKVQLGLRELAVDFEVVGTDERFRAVQEGRIDVLCGAATATLGRRADVGFSIPIFAGGVGGLLRKDAPARLRAALSGEPAPQEPRWRASMSRVLEKRTYAVVSGTTTVDWLNERKSHFQIIAEISQVPNYPAGVQQILDRSSDVFFGDRAILLAAATRSPSAKDLMVLDRLFTYEPLALALPRGDEDLRLAVDRSLSRLYRSGEISEVYTKFFGKPDEKASTFFRLMALPE